ncbi:tobamovirus multiplication 1-like [Micractinium conductrix]|uniref:fumarate reductase (NADH) n=1 Tax=Micractinium conductrix TaxID=554055 RepID=A0A2P6VDF0_9CHLO|nr:tobamovirus multiplication 1-like [Micractinium conductrix]|eukprot:PSC72118.1 tobamovirus multiplication 1-like [Micractinium conductrix]
MPGLARHAPRIVVVGSGLAGTAAALAAAEAGGPLAEVMVLEKEPRPGGNSMKASSGINALEPAEGDSMADFRGDTLKSGGGLSVPELVDALVAGSQEAVGWLEKQGIDLSGRVQLGGHTRKRTHTSTKGPVGFSIMKALLDLEAKEERIRVITGAKVEELQHGQDGGRVTGVVYRAANGSQHMLPASAVVLATGGFGASTALLRWYAPQTAELPTTNGPWAQGEGLELAARAGAALMQLEQVQVHPTGFVDPSDPSSGTKFLAPEKLRGVGGILLNSEGKRFVDELSTRDRVTQNITAQPGKQARLLLGSEVAAAFGPALGFYVSKSLFTKHDDLAAAAAHMGVPPATLAAEVAAYNEAAATGRDQFDKTVFPARVDPAQPVYVATITPVVHYTMGGVAINSEAQALDANGVPIPGLFAAGEVAGGVHGANRLGGNSLLDAAPHHALQTMAVGQQQPVVRLLELAAVGKQRDLQKAVRFYGEGIGLPVRVVTERWAELSAGPSTLALKAAYGEAYCSTGYSPVLAFNVQDLQATLVRCLEQGASMDGAVQHSPHGKVAALRAPDGVMISLLETGGEAAEQLAIDLPQWWHDIDANPMWQKGAFDGLAVAYGALALVALIQIVRIQLRVPEYGWTTQKVFHLLNFLVCGLRSGVFAARVAVQDLPYPLMQAVLLDLPGLLFFSTYTLLVLFWAEIYYQARSLPTGSLRPAFVVMNLSVYVVQAGLWVYCSLGRPGAAREQLGQQLSGCFLAFVSAAAAFAFLLYGGRLWLMLRRFPIESRGRRKKLREVGLVTSICATCFLFRSIIVAWSIFDYEDADLDVMGHPLLNMIYYSGAEIIPSGLVLYILRKLPPKRQQQGYQQIPAHPRKMPAGSEERDAAYEEAPLLASWPGAADPPPPPPLPSAAAAAAAKQGSVAGPRTVELSARSEACVQAGGPACDSLQPASSARRSVDGSAAGGLHPAGVPWGVTAALLLADMFGIGALALPSVFARLGWLVSFLLLATFACGCAYLGVLFSRLAVACPTAITFDDIGHAALPKGNLGRRLCYGLVYTTIVADPIALHITCVFALRMVFPELGVLAAAAIVAAIMLPLSQIQSVHDMSWLALAATGCMFTAIIATLARLLTMPDALHGTSLLPPPSTRMIEGLVAALNLTFAFGGQVNWMRYIGAMGSHKSEFRFAAELADSLMLLFYLLLGVTAYSKLGSDFDTSKPVTSVLPPGAWSRAINALLLARCLVAYALNANVFTHLFVRVLRVEARFPKLGGRGAWAAVSICCVCMSFLVAWAVPSFDLVVAVIAAFGDVAAPYTLPALFALALLPLPSWERRLLNFVVVVSVVFTAAGLYAASYALVQRMTA